MQIKQDWNAFTFHLYSDKDYVLPFWSINVSCQSWANSEPWQKNRATSWSMNTLLGRRPIWLTADGFMNRIVHVSHKFYLNFFILSSFLLFNATTSIIAIYLYFTPTPVRVCPNIYIEWKIYGCKRYVALSDPACWINNYINWISITNSCSSNWSWRSKIKSNQVSLSVFIHRFDLPIQSRARTPPYCQDLLCSPGKRKIYSPLRKTRGNWRYACMDW